jgi:hypothetical protein
LNSGEMMTRRLLKASMAFKSMAISISERMGSPPVGRDHPWNETGASRKASGRSPFIFYHISGKLQSIITPVQSFPRDCSRSPSMAAGNAPHKAPWVGACKNTPTCYNDRRTLLEEEK